MGRSTTVIERIDSTIRLLCREIAAAAVTPRDWQNRTEEDLLYEVCVCTLSSQTLFEVAEATAQYLRTRGVLRASAPEMSSTAYQQIIADSLSNPVEVPLSGGVKKVRPRFRNRAAALLAATLESVYGRGTSLEELLFSAPCPTAARRILIKCVHGFGPKQSSLFLRRIGYCVDLAVFDIHILDYLTLVRGMKIDRRRVTVLAYYEQLEREFKRIADEFGHPIECVDLAIWITMRVAKKEAHLWP